MKVQLFLQLLDFLGTNGYFVRTDLEKQVFKDLLTQGLVHKKARTKFCYLLSSKGKEVLTMKESLINTDHTLLEPKTTTLRSQEEFRKLIKATVLKLITPLCPMVRIPELWNSLKQAGLNDSERQLFEHTLLDMHTNNELTLHEGFSISEADNGIQSNKNQSYYYIIIES